MAEGFSNEFCTAEHEGTHDEPVRRIRAGYVVAPQSCMLLQLITAPIIVPMAPRNDDYSWSPGHGELRARLAQQRNSKPARGRKPIPTPRQEELDSLSESEKVKVARRLRNRASATSSRLKAQGAASLVQTAAAPVSLEEQIEEVQEENAMLRTALAARDAELETLKAQFTDLKAHIDQLMTPGAATMQLPSASEILQEEEDHLMPDGTLSSQVDQSIFENPPPLTPTNTAAERNPSATLPPLPAGDCDLNTVMQWTYPGLALPPVRQEPTPLEEDIPLVFTPFAPIASPRESLFGPGGQAGFGAWRPSLRGVEESDDFPPRENSGVVRELARMASSPAAFYTHPGL